MHPKRFLGPGLPFRDYVKEEQLAAPAETSGEWVNPFEKWRESDEHGE